MFFAEVLVPSSVFPFFTATGLLFVLPLYLLHLVILAGIIYYVGRPSFSVLYSAGFLFGLYEAYVTKVLWVPTWEVASYDLYGGVHFLVVLVVVGFWHCFLAFILPLVIADTFLVREGELFKNLPYTAQRVLGTSWGIGILAVFFGVLSTSIMEQPLHLLSPLFSGLLVFVLLYIFRNSFKNFRMKDLLPEGVSLYVCIFLLMAIYLLAGIFIRQEFLPITLLPHETIWFMYLVVGGTFFRGLSQSKHKKVSEVVQVHTYTFPWGKALGIFFVFIFVGATSFMFLSLAVRTLVLILSWIPFVLIASSSILYTLKKIYFDTK